MWLGSVLTYHYVTAEELERDVLPNIPELGTTGTRSDPGGVLGISRETGNDAVAHTNRKAQGPLEKEPKEIQAEEPGSCWPS